jgi:hypothetical protein
MSRCLKDRTLLRLHDGAGSAAERAHLTECEACGARYRGLGSDLAAISQILRQAPPPEAVRHRFRPFPRRRWLPAAVAAGLTLLLVWQGARIWGPRSRPVLHEEVWSLVGELSADLFLLNEAVAEEVWLETADGVAALEAEWSCEGNDTAETSEAESFDGELQDLGADAPSGPCGA